MRYGVAGVIPGREQMPCPAVRGRQRPDRATTLHGSCNGARLAYRARRAGVAGPTLEAHLQPAQGVERGVHSHELADQALRLIGHPAELLPAHRLERAGELIVETQQLGDVAHAVLTEATHQLAVVPDQVFGFASNVDLHAPLLASLRAY